MNLNPRQVLYSAVRSLLAWSLYRVILIKPKALSSLQILQGDFGAIAAITSGCTACPHGQLCPEPFRTLHSLPNLRVMNLWAYLA